MNFFALLLILINLKPPTILYSKNRLGIPKPKPWSQLKSTPYIPSRLDQVYQNTLLENRSRLDALDCSLVGIESIDWRIVFWNWEAVLGNGVAPMCCIKKSPWIVNGLPLFASCDIQYKCVCLSLYAAHTPTHVPKRHEYVSRLYVSRFCGQIPSSSISQCSYTHIHTCIYTHTIIYMHTNTYPFYIWPFFITLNLIN